MKNIIHSILATALLASGGGAWAQVDDVYMSPSKIAERAKQEQQEQAAYSQNRSNTYNNNEGDYNNYSSGSQDGYYEDEYIDYDDDNYTSRIRRFQYPMMGVGYWGSLYNPYAFSPFGAGAMWSPWHSPGISFSMGMGFGWGSAWGYQPWYNSYSMFGYGGFYNPWYGGGFGRGFYSPWGWGGGYGHGGYGHGDYYNPRRNVVYGPRNNRIGVRNSPSNATGAYGRSTGVRGVQNSRGENVVQPMRGQGQRNARFGENTGRISVDRQNSNNNIIIDRGNRVNQNAVQFDRSNNNNIQRNTPTRRIEGVNNNNMQNIQRRDLQQQPSRNVEMRRAEPQRQNMQIQRSQQNNNFRSSPSFNSGGGFRSSGGGAAPSGGGGGRSTGSRR